MKAIIKELASVVVVGWLLMLVLACIGAPFFLLVYCIFGEVQF